MEQVAEISLDRLMLMSLPLLAVWGLYYKLKLKHLDFSGACLRMLSQLIGIGFVLSFLFELNQPWWTLLIFAFMLSMAAWIATRPLPKRKSAFRAMAVSLLFGCVPVLFLVVGFVLPAEPWYKPNHFIPLAGMILSNAMNAVSLAADRLERELERGSADATSQAFETALIPTLNSFFAVGVVSLPGMMTGQILSGVSPLIAVRYQIVVMAMVMGASGLSVALYIWGLERARSRP
ncbi:ABC transporter permease [Pseudobacteriovorax antillogorgiicola]|uniref:Putative ABC transport system permease protein n=1 Tax=Pseudobacteriovorax antillogorgiicola TaxID=1513793 RepID=A0A1Y6CCK1_9BACT|nr:ABC transporter permease [Pseudobacteriovorax antillogorgiicola]TCS48284.1 putative ABC transport system permease protein [Pseudobacteriovorax antillogorgiicola]SMF56962.1 putative ABC transport system permease protein [Pseudobacteriovorax antillogorgiicola]